MRECISPLTSRDQLGTLLSTRVPMSVEIGTYNGAFAKKILDWFPDGTLYLVDFFKSHANMPEPQEAYDTRYLSVVSKFIEHKNVVIIRADSSPTAQVFPDSFFDFIYIDADHTYEAVLADLRAWYPKVKYGGVLSGHDYADYQPYMVKPALETYFSEIGRDSQQVFVIHADPSEGKSFYTIKE